MGLFKIRTTIAGIASLLAASSSLFADAVVDGTFDDNQNEYGFYWYYYDDNAGVGSNDRPQCKDGPGTPSVINVASKDSVRQAFGNTSDTYKIKSYTFTTDEAAGNKFATTPFTFGTKWTASYGKAFPYIGIGTMLNKDGKWADISKATKVTFKIKSRVKDLTVRFKIQTFEIDSISNVPGDKLEGDEFGYYGTSVVATKGTWYDASITIADMELPGSWARDIPMNLKRATKLAWEVGMEANDATTVDTLDIDDITIVGDGYTAVLKDVWTDVKPVASYGVPVGKVFASFDNSPYNATPLGTYWYAYNDANIGGNSTVSEEYATLDAETKLLTLKWIDGSGVNDKGRGLKLEYQLGKSVKQGDNNVQGFIGLGANLYDSAKVKYYNADSLEVKGIYFQYVTQMDQKYLTIELSDVNDVGDKDNPTRKDSRGSGVVYYRNLPNTQGEWKAAFIPFDSLVYHDDWQGSKNIALDKKKLAKIQWKVQGGNETGGTVAIDNVYFIGSYTPGTGAIVSRSNFRKSAFNTSFANGNICVSAENFKNGTVSLFSSNGTRIASQPVALKTTFAAKSLPAGMYIVKVNAFDVNGKAVSMQSPVTLVK